MNSRLSHALFKELSLEFEKVLKLFQTRLSENLDFEEKGNEKKEEDLKKIIKQVSRKDNQKRILSEFSGYGPLASVLKDEAISEILINGPKNIFFEKKGRLLKLEDHFLSSLTFNNMVEKVSSQAGLSLNLKRPFDEGKWGPFRIHILRPPLVKEDFHLALRRQIFSHFTLKKLEELDWAPPEAFQILKRIIDDKKNFLIVGSTSSGKTSALNACLNECDEFERVICLEDTDEITLPNKVSAKLLTLKNPEQGGDFISLQTLTKQSLRLRPDRIVMGEVRGEEAKDLILALSSGHKGSIGTLHATDHKQALWRLETLIQMGAPQWQSFTVKQLIFSSLQVILVLEKKEGIRVLKGIYQISSLESSGFLFETLWER